MKKQRINTATASTLLKYKDNHYHAQIQQVIEVFQEKPLTMLEVSHRTGIERANICRYIATLRKENKIQLVKKTFCPITKHRAGFYTTDKSAFVQSLTLF